MAFVVPAAVWYGVGVTAAALTAGGIAAKINTLDLTRPPDIPMQLPPGLYQRWRHEARAREMKLDYKKKINIAIIGRQKLGKSSLVNALRGLSYSAKDAAVVDVTEHTEDASSYQMCSETWGQHVVLWDLPGAGSLEHPVGEYFTKFCLYLFDILIIVAETVEEGDKMLITTAIAQDVNFVLVRSKGDEFVSQHHKKVPDVSKENCALEAIKKYNESVNEVLQKFGTRRYVERCLICSDTVLKIQTQQRENIESHLRLLNEDKLLSHIDAVIQQRRMRRKKADVNTGGATNNPG